MTNKYRKGKAIEEDDDEDGFYAGGSMTNGRGKGKGKAIEMGFQEDSIEDEDDMY